MPCSRSLLSLRDLEPPPSERGEQLKRAFLLLTTCVLTACASKTAENNAVAADQEAAAAAGNGLNRISEAGEASDPRQLVDARFFVNPVNRHVDLTSIRRNTEPEATINRHYSLSIVSCGTPCIVYWIIDRDTGGVIDVPWRTDNEATGYTEMLYGVEGRIDSDIIKVTYGPTDSLSDEGCRSQHFRLSGHSLSPTGGSYPAPCPES